MQNDCMMSCFLRIGTTWNELRLKQEQTSVIGKLKFHWIKLIFLSLLADICSCFDYKLTSFWYISTNFSFWFSGKCILILGSLGIFTYNLNTSFAVWPDESKLFPYFSGLKQCYSNFEKCTFRENRHIVFHSIYYFNVSYSVLKRSLNVLDLPLKKPAETL